MMLPNSNRTMFKTVYLCFWNEFKQFIVAFSFSRKSLFHSLSLIIRYSSIEFVSFHHLETKYTISLFVLLLHMHTLPSFFPHCSSKLEGNKDIDVRFLRRLWEINNMAYETKNQARGVHVPFIAYECGMYACTYVHMNTKHFTN